MFDTELFKKFLDQMRNDSKLDVELKIIDRHMVYGRFHIDCMKTFPKGSEDWVHQLGEAGGAYHAAGRAMIDLHDKLEKSNEQS
jgi:hypothetical protein